MYVINFLILLYWNVKTLTWEQIIFFLILFQAYDGYDEYEPHTGDPQYDLDFDKQYYQMPDVVCKWLSTVS